MSAPPLDDRPITRSRAKTLTEPGETKAPKNTKTGPQPVGTSDTHKPSKEHQQQIPKKRGPSRKRVNVRARIKRKKMSPSPQPSPHSSPLKAAGKSNTHKEHKQTTNTDPQPSQPGADARFPIVENGTTANGEGAGPDTASKAPEDTKTQEDIHNQTPIVPITEELMEDLEDTRDVHMSDMNSSPIKPHAAKWSPEVPQTIPGSSSPIKRKNVVFSDNLTSDVPFLPEDGTTTPVCITATPKKPILKAGFGEDKLGPHSPLSVKETPFTPTNFQPQKASYWSKGNIVQLPPESPLMGKLISGCIAVLKNKSFNKRFEVYASLNHNFKTNTSEFNQSVLVPTNKSASPSKTAEVSSKDNVSILSALVQRDILAIEESLDLTRGDGQEDNKENVSASPSKNDPFCTRTISQALKMISYFMIDPELNVHMSVEDSRWFYTHAANIIVKPKVSKTMAIPYLGIIKECRFGLKKKRLIFNSVNGMDIPEHMLFAILNMRNFPSTTLVTEKFAAIRNFVQNFPLMMANNFKHWFEVYLMNMCHLTNPYYAKVVGNAMVTLLEISRVYIKNKDVNFMVLQCLDQGVPSSFKSFSSEDEVVLHEGNADIGTTNYEILVSTIEALVESKKYKAAADLWVGISLLCCDREKGFDSWNHIDSWINALFGIMASKDPVAHVNAIGAWKAVVYNVCVTDLENLQKYVTSKDLQFLPDNTYQMSERLEHKFELALTFLKRINPSLLSQEALSTVHGVILAIFYGVLNSQVSNSLGFLNVYWDKLVSPIFQNFYFHPSKRSKNMLPMGIRTLLKLTKRETSEASSFHSLRCLSNETMNITEVRSFDEKWVHANKDRILSVVHPILVSKEVRPGFKFSLLNVWNDVFEDSVKYPLTSTTLQSKKFIHDIIVDSFEGVQLDAEGVAKLFKFAKSLLTLHNMTNIDGFENKSGDIMAYLMNMLTSLVEDQRVVAITKIFEQIEPSKTFFLIAYLVKLNVIDQESSLIQERLNLCKMDVSSTVEVRVVGMLFEVLFTTYHSFAKSVVQAMVLLDEPSFERITDLVAVKRWNQSIFEYFLVLVEPAPQKWVRQSFTNLVVARLEKKLTAWRMSTFLLNNHAFDVSEFRNLMLAQYHEMDTNDQHELRKLWMARMLAVQQSGRFDRLDKDLVATVEHGIKLSEWFVTDWCPLFGAKVAEIKKTNASIEYELRNPPAAEAVIAEEEQRLKAYLRKEWKANNIVPIFTDIGCENKTDMSAVAPISSAPGRPSPPQQPEANPESDSDSDSPNNTFSSETGNDSDGDDSFIATEKELSSEDSVADKPQEPTSVVEVAESVPRTSMQDGTVSMEQEVTSLESVSKIEVLQQAIESLDEHSLKQMPSAQQEKVEVQLLNLLLQIKAAKTPSS